MIFPESEVFLLVLPGINGKSRRKFAQPGFFMIRHTVTGRETVAEIVKGTVGKSRHFMLFQHRHVRIQIGDSPCEDGMAGLIGFSEAEVGTTENWGMVALRTAIRRTFEGLMTLITAGIISVWTAYWAKSSLRPTNIRR